MKSLKGTMTEKNLLCAFAGESQARNRYTFFASAAKKEGYEQISAFFTETADNEKEHAKKFFKFLEGGMVEITASFPAGVIGSTADNLKAAADGELEEWMVAYPEFARIAKEEGFPENYGLLQSNIMFRKHNKEACIKLMKTWSDEVVNNSHRDQLSFNYALWKSKDVKIIYMDKKIYKSSYFNWKGGHAKKNKVLRNTTTHKERMENPKAEFHNIMNNNKDRKVSTYKVPIYY
jgi:rubrerythrin